MEVVIEKLEYLLDSYKHMVNILFTTASVVCVWFVFRMGGINKVPSEMFSYIFSNGFFLLALSIVLVIQGTKEILRSGCESCCYGKVGCILLSSLLLVAYTMIGNGWVFSFLSIFFYIVVGITARIIRIAVGIFLKVREWLRQRRRK